jgi:hypothetical protein
MNFEPSVELFNEDVFGARRAASLEIRVMARPQHRAAVAVEKLRAD